MRLHLAWRGPLGPGAFPVDDAALEALDEPGVYLRVKRYDNDRLVAYVGQSRHLLARIDQHLVNTLGLAYPLRDAAGRPVFRGDFRERAHGYNALAEAAALALAEASRTRFYYALCDADFELEYLNAVEHLLMTRVAARITCSEARLAGENRVAAPGDDAACSIGWDLARLAPADAALLERLLGAAPIVQAEEPAAHDG